MDASSWFNPEAHQCDVVVPNCDDPMFGFVWMACLIQTLIKAHYRCNFLPASILGMLLILF